MNDALIPVPGCFVCEVTRQRIGQVVDLVEGSRIRVRFGDGTEQILSEGEWSNGIHPGFTVQDAPLSASRTPLGVGTAVAVRTLGGREQVGVQLHADGSVRWLPFEHLVRIMDPMLQYARARTALPLAAERTALNLMGRALETFNDATGALGRLDVDPLPHQISLVHRILMSGKANWIIADDVGLGKTIEVGLLLGAMERKHNLRRILVIVPSGLTRQWKDEMLTKFDRLFAIYGRDFEIEHAREWAGQDLVITSLDLVKPQSSADKGDDPGTRFGTLLTAPAWDLVIFDEAHRLSRDEAGRSTLRFALAHALRSRTDQMLLLTGTPHQGDDGKFANLLRLVRPDLKAAIRTLDANPEVVGDIVIRNRKIDAVDIDGRFLFRGVSVNRIEIPLSAEAARLDKHLAAYLRLGYRAGSERGGAGGRAIGFVMTIYRKLASSSVASLLIALLRRRARLIGQDQDAPTVPAEVAEDPLNETDDTLASSHLGEPDNAFFDNEIAMLDAVLAQARLSLRADPKGEMFKTLVRAHVLEGGRNLLVFTEYRATQQYLAFLVEMVTGAKPLMIHGGMSVDEKRHAVEAFDDGLHVMISTEAGGEGLNLQRNCHVMVNFDLPWNPARLAQRIGRLYRYGQDKTVVVLNFHARDTIDNEVLARVFERLDRIIAGMRTTSPEFDDRYHAEVLGELLERLDITALLEQVESKGADRNDAQIDEALAAADRARRIQDDVLARASVTGQDGWKSLGAFRPSDLATFIKRAAAAIAIGVEERGVAERFALRLPDTLKGRFPEFGRSQVIEATTLRSSADKARRSLVLLDFASDFVLYLIESVKKPDFGGGYGARTCQTDEGRLIAAWSLAMQDEQGHPRGEELLVTVRDRSGRIAFDTTAIRDLFLAPIVSAEPVQPGAAEMAERHQAIEACRDRAEAEIANRSSRFLHPSMLYPVGVLEDVPAQLEDQPAALAISGGSTGGEKP